jgi:hypothetical protein
MRRIRTVGLLCVVAVFAASALAASAASAALPEYKTCIKKAGGNFTNKTCSGPETPGTGKYELGEWNQGSSTTFTGKSKNPVNETVNPFTHTVEAGVTCKTEAVEGKLTGPKTANIKSHWKKCHVVGLKVACQTPGSGSGEIIGDALESKLIYLNSAKTKVGVRIKPQSGKELAKYDCNGEAVKITATGEVIGEDQGNVNVFSKKNKTHLQAGSGGDKLQAFAYEEEKGTEANENGFIEWASSLDEDPPVTVPDVDPNLAEFEACVTEGVVSDAQSVPVAEGTCVGAFGPNDDNNEPGESGKNKEFGYPGVLSGVPVPAFILSEAKGAGPGKEAPAPATQVGTTENKGQSMEVKA